MYTPTPALTALAVTAGLTLTGLAGSGSATTSTAGTTLQGPSASSTAAPSPGASYAHTAEVVAATRAFLRALWPDQREAVLFGFDDPL
jgi:hypothetical protein